MNMTSSHAAPIEVITKTQTRKRWSEAEKKAMILESPEPGQSISAVEKKVV